VIWPGLENVSRSPKRFRKLEAPIKAHRAVFGNCQM
jgi:hypothetical protein